MFGNTIFLTVNMAARMLVGTQKLVKSAKIFEIGPCVRTFCTENVKSLEPDNKVTHTGQHWKKDDYRMARFIDHPKQINENFAIDLINEIPPKPVKDRVVWCDGGDGPLGHPKVYINVDQPGPHACGYCGLRFVLEKKHH